MSTGERLSASGAWVLCVALLLVQGAGHATDAPPPVQADRFADIAAIDPVVEVIGDGAFVSRAPAMDLTVNPHGTLVAGAEAIPKEPHAGVPLEIHALPDGARLDLGWLGDAALQSCLQIAWLDDHRLFVVGRRWVVSPEAGIADGGWYCQFRPVNAEGCAWIDLDHKSFRFETFPGWTFCQACALNDVRTTASLVLFHYSSNAGFYENGAGQRNRRVGMFPDVMMMQVDLLSGRRSMQAMMSSIAGAHYFELACQPGSPRCLVVSSAPNRTGGDARALIWDPTAARFDLQCRVPDPALMPMHARWGRDADHIEILGRTQGPVTWTLDCRTRSWTSSQGWSIRPSPRCDPQLHDVATIGVHAVTLADGRSVPIVQGASSGNSPIDESIVGTWLERSTTDGSARYAVAACGTAMRVIDLRHGYALSPSVDALVAQPSVAFMSDGSLTLWTPATTWVVHDGLVKWHRNSQHDDQVTYCAAGPFMLTSNADSEVFAENVLTGVRHAEPAGPFSGFIRGSATGDSVLIMMQSGVLRVLHPADPSFFWDLPVVPRATGEGPKASWNADGTTCYLGSLPSGSDGTNCCGAWNVQTRTLAWRPLDSTGFELPIVSDMVPNATGSQVLVRLMPKPPRPRVRLPWIRGISQPAYSRIVPDDYYCGILDGTNGMWLRAAADPGADAVFTPDSSRVVGPNGIIRVSDGQQIAAFEQDYWSRYWTYISPSGTWRLRAPNSGDWELDDCSGCGLSIRMERPRLMPAQRFPQFVVWDRSEGRVAITFANDMRVFCLSLLLPPRAGRFDDSAFARLESADWMTAAADLAGMGAPAVAALERGQLTAHRLIALEMCARAGARDADAALGRAAVLAGPLGYLASDCPFRIHELRRQQAAQPTSP